MNHSWIEVIHGYESISTIYSRQAKLRKSKLVPECMLLLSMTTIKDVCCKSNKSKTKQLLAVIKDADYNQFTAIYGKPINKQRLKIVENDISVITRDKIISTLPLTNLKRDIYEYDQNIDVDL